MKFQNAQNKYICFYLNCSPRSRINPFHFRKVNCLPINDIVECSIAMCQDIFIKCLSHHAADVAQDHRWHYIYSCGKGIKDKHIYLY